jgi:alpha-beta hydrolase superfamily lysophospholipase
MTSAIPCRIVLAVAFALLAVPSWATVGERVDLTVRGKVVALTIYRPLPPPGKVKGTVIMGSGDVGWLGLAASMAAFLSDEGYVVVGINIRRYLSTFTIGDSHLTPSVAPDDYAAIAAYLRTRDLLRSPVVVSGVSEGAAFAVLAASTAASHAWISGVITMGLPATAELAWRWSDFTTWLTKKDATEPSFAPKDFIPLVSPLPLCMIQSTKDEYVTEAEYRELMAAARAPKKLVLINASNHRFTDRLPDLHHEYLAALAWILTAARPPAASLTNAR